jgi:hypothetical protein
MKLGRTQMKMKLTLWAIAAGLFLTAAGWMHAQDTTTQQPSTATTSDNTTNDTHANVRTLTGCLQKGEGSKEYELVGDDGSTWEVRSDAVDLASHVGHTVTLTGAVRNATMHGMKEDAKREAQEHGMDKSATEHGHMTVTNVSMVSSSCSK